jgi:putative transposase
MPRVKRALADNCTYHVLNRGNAKQTVFNTLSDYRAFRRLMQTAKERWPVRTLAYCLMPNHFHLVVQPELGEELSNFMQWLMTSHVRRHHQRRGTSGHVWQGRYKSFRIECDSHLLVVMRYVERNPVRAGLAASAIDWPWSSHKERLGQASPVVIDACPIQLPVDWAGYVNEPLSEAELGSLRQSVNRQSPYGTAQWQSKVCAKYGLESTLRPRGRPRKMREM